MYAFADSLKRNHLVSRRAVHYTCARAVGSPGARRAFIGLLALLVIGLAGCLTGPNPNFCEGAPNNDCRLAEGDGGPTADAQGCDPAAPDCPISAPMCSPDGVCVECLNAGQCAGNPNGAACDPNGRCGCSLNADCDDVSRVCDIGGACAAEDDVVYVDGRPGIGDDANSMCGIMGRAGTPCASIMRGIEQSAGRRFVYVAAALYSEQVVIDANVTVIGEINGMERVLVVPGGQDNPALIMMGGDATIDGLVLRSAISGGNNLGHGVDCRGGRLSLQNLTSRQNDGFGIHAAAGCENLDVRRSVIQNNLSGGVMLEGGEFTFENNVITANGSGSSNVGGVRFAGTGTQGSLLFNTIVNNQKNGNPDPPGVSCKQTSAVNAVANLVQANQPDNLQQIEGGLCSWNYSAVGGNHNGFGENMLEQDCTMELGADFRFTGPSACVNYFTEPTTPAVDIDIDGDPRPNGGAYDIGADELL